MEVMEPFVPLLTQKKFWSFGRVSASREFTCHVGEPPSPDKWLPGLASGAKSGPIVYRAMHKCLPIRPCQGLSMKEVPGTCMSNSQLRQLLGAIHRSLKNLKPTMAGLMESTAARMENECGAPSAPSRGKVRVPSVPQPAALSALPRHRLK